MRVSASLVALRVLRSRPLKTARRLRRLGRNWGACGLCHGSEVQFSRLRRRTSGEQWIGSFGRLARMTVFGLIGVFLIKAAIEYDPNEAVGLDGALARLARPPTAHSCSGSPPSG